MKARSDLAIEIGWNVRNLHYVQKLKPLSEYLKPKTPSSPEDAAADLRAMVARMAAKQKGKRDE